MKDNDIQVPLGERIRYWRDKAGLSTVDVARQIGVDPSAVSHWEGGRSSPQTKHLIALAEACGIDMRIFWSPIEFGAAAAR